MEAVVFQCVGEVRRTEVPEPRLNELFDAIVRIQTSAAVSGTDWHMIHGTMMGTVVSMNVSE